MNSKIRYQSYGEFWPFYLAEHGRPLTRRFHFIGTSLVILSALLGIFVAPQWFWVMPLAGYSFAWSSHFFIEKNRPATFTYPFWSLFADFHMFFLTLTGRIDAEIARLSTHTPPSTHPS